MVALAVFGFLCMAVGWRTEGLWLLLVGSVSVSIAAMLWLASYVSPICSSGLITGAEFVRACG